MQRPCGKKNLLGTPTSLLSFQAHRSLPSPSPLALQMTEGERNSKGAPDTIVLHLGHHRWQGPCLKLFVLLESRAPQ